FYIYFKFNMRGPAVIFLFSIQVFIGFILLANTDFPRPAAQSNLFQTRLMIGSS
ncbi:hypothetical protein L9F63_027331, partial [Diploptera punctata]